MFKVNVSNLAVSAGSGANYSSTQLYSENFSGQNNKGALHTGFRPFWSRLDS